MGMCPLLVSCPKKEGRPGDGLFNNVSFDKIHGKGAGLVDREWVGDIHHFRHSKHS